MATVLDKSVIRESTVKVTGREILVTLGDDQSISMKLKGMKSGEVVISIIDLYEQLTGGPAIEHSVIEVESVVPRDEKLDKTQKDNPTISLYELRTRFATTPMAFDTHALFDGVIASCIREKRNPVLAAEKLMKAKEMQKR